ncbi:MAG: sugar phosphate nucleotidyltransferase, partial [Cyanobium sp.]
MKRVLAIILGGGAGTRLQPLTTTRAKPAVPLGGKYRLIDIPVSNCINSGIEKIYVLTQFNSQSLNRHLSLTYNLSSGFGGGFVEVLAAQQTPTSPSWFEGTADAVRQNQELFEGWDVDQVLILSGDQLYRMDYAAFVAAHRASGAALTVAALPVDAKAA